MNLKQSWKNFLDKYLKNTAEQIDATQFSEDEVRRYRIIFSGIVQGVGFRYETWAIAQKLQLTGFVENLAIQIDEIEIDEIDLKEENSFEIAN